MRSSQVTHSCFSFFSFLQRNIVQLREKKRKGEAKEKCDNPVQPAQLGRLQILGWIWEYADASLRSGEFSALRVEKSSWHQSAVVMARSLLPLWVHHLSRDCLEAQEFHLGLKYTQSSRPSSTRCLLFKHPFIIIIIKKKKISPTVGSACQLNPVNILYLINKWNNLLLLYSTPRCCRTQELIISLLQLEPKWGSAQGLYLVFFILNHPVHPYSWQHHERDWEIWLWTYCLVDFFINRLHHWKAGFCPCLTLCLSIIKNIGWSKKSIYHTWNLQTFFYSMNSYHWLFLGVNSR